MAGGHAVQGQKITVEAYIVKPCVNCGRPTTEHKTPTCPNGCLPGRIEDKGLRDYTHPRWICRRIWAIEKWLQGHRERFERQE